MAKTVTAAFNKFMQDSVNLTAAERKQGETSHNYLRQILDEYAAKDATFPRLLDGDFLSGSFARKTKLRPLNDIDIMMIVDGQGLVMINGDGTVKPGTIRGSGSEGNPLNTATYYIDGTTKISSIKVLNAFKKAIKSRYPDSTEVGRDGQVVNVYLSSYGLGLDVIPALEFLPEGADRPHYYIPKGSNDPTWMATNPKIDKRWPTRLTRIAVMKGCKSRRSV